MLKKYSSNQEPTSKSKKNDLLHLQVPLGGTATTSSKNAKKEMEDRRNLAMSPKNISESTKGLQSVALIQKSSLE